ncbi:MAG: nucleotidyl transferase AbiEii/AbiGii toxin family protein [Sulfurimonas sp.]|nr:nucleotidyl transferase AbiEii/AbiGii toxin family protein [Sulfurimonas sp.]
MEKEIDYTALYKLQDEVLDIVVSLKSDFYLTGGTALHRFYYNARYSDDLDFFVTNSETMNESFNEIVQELSDLNYEVKIDVKSRDFCRATINKTLQLDFVNDRVYRYKKSNIINSIKIDNKINILTNKINTIINRDEEKDVFDLFCLAYHEEFNWGKIFEIANKKAVIEKDVFIYRLKSFPIQWLERIKKIKEINITENEIKILCDEVLNELDNSLKIY